MKIGQRTTGFELRRHRSPASPDNPDPGAQKHDNDANSDDQNQSRHELSIALYGTWTQAGIYGYWLD